MLVLEEHKNTQSKSTSENWNTVEKQSPVSRRFHLKSEMERIEKIEGDVEEALGEMLVQMEVEKGRLRGIIEECSEQLVVVVPEAVEEVLSVQKEYLMLKESFDGMYKKMDAMDESTVCAVKALQFVDTIKDRINMCAETLHEMQNWDQRVDRVIKCMESRDFLKIAEEVRDMRNVVRVLKLTPMHEQREKQLQEFVSDLIVMTKSVLAKAFCERDLESVQVFCTVYRYIEKQKKMKMVYIDSISDRVEELCGEFRDDGFESEEWVRRLVDKVAGFVETEYRWCVSVEGFEHPLMEDSCVTAVLQRYSSLFSNWVEVNVNEEPSNLFQFIGTILNYTRRLLDRLSSFHLNEGSKTVYIIAPLLKCFASYKTLCEAYLLKTLDAMRFVTDSGVDIEISFRNALELMQSNHDRVIAVLESVVQMCIECTFAICVLEMKEAMENCINEYVRMNFQVLKQLRKITELKSSVKPGEQLPSWSRIELSLSLLRNVKRFQFDLDTFKGRFLSCLDVSKSKPEDKLMHTMMLQDLSKYDSIRQWIESPPADILQASQQSLQSLLESSEGFVFDAIMIPIRSSLCDMHQWSVWAAPMSSNEARLPSFSVQPSAPITQVGDALFLMAQQIDLHSGKEAEGMEDVMFWLARSVNGTSKMFVDQLLRIPHLSKKGVRQLVADLEYLVSVIEALGAPIDMQLVVCKNALLMEENELQETQFPSQMERKLARKIASIRHQSVE